MEFYASRTKRIILKMNNDQLYFYNRKFNDCLAKFVDTHPVKELTDEEIATMLRQQQAEIEQLKALVISLSPNSNLIYTRSKK